MLLRFNSLDVSNYKNNNMIKFFILFILISSNLFAQEFEILYTEQVNNNDNLFITNDKGVIKQLTYNKRKDSSPMQSPDGKHIVFTSERKGWWKIWLLEIEQMSFKQLTNVSSAEYSPSWSPDGKQIVFVSSRDGNEEIYVMDMDGKNIRNITNKKNSDIMPFWGTDNYIYYSTKINSIYQMARCKPDGSKNEIFTNTIGNKLMPQISKDLTKILYYGDKDGNLEIYIMNLKDNSIIRLTDNPLVDRRPRWSTDNKNIVFERGNKGNNHHIYILNVENKNTKQLTFKNYNYAPSFVNIDKTLLID